MWRSRWSLWQEWGSPAGAEPWCAAQRSQCVGEAAPRSTETFPRESEDSRGFSGSALPSVRPQGSLYSRICLESECIPHLSRKEAGCIVLTPPGGCPNSCNVYCLEGLCTLLVKARSLNGFGGKLSSPEHSEGPIKACRHVSSRDILGFYLWKRGGSALHLISHAWPCLGVCPWLLVTAAWVALRTPRGPRHTCPESGCRRPLGTEPRDLPGVPLRP